jgi:hypothetical protein
LVDDRELGQQGDAESSLGPGPHDGHAAGSDPLDVRAE